MKHFGKYIPTILKFTFLCLIFIFTVFPIIYVVLSSFKTNMEILSASTNLLPAKFQFQNYIQAWKIAKFGTYTWNSLYMCFFIVIGTIITSTMAGYVFSRGEFKGKKIIFMIISATMFISAGSLYLYPQLQIAKFLGINTNLWGVIIIRVFGINVTQVFLSRGYINTISPEIDEAARIDGCGFIRIFFNIIFPLLKPLVATIGILSFMAGWNDYLLPMVFTMSNSKNAPLVVGVINLKSTGETVGSYHLMLSGTVLSVIPMILVYLGFNKYFIAGLTSGAVKG